ncbi:MAG: hypothetical protein SFY68_08785 [Candidatus Sumerlaeia bacterium]|nr:hypothetical protein [Candidatus Sumerlaeia bacterium]
METLSLLMLVFGGIVAIFGAIWLLLEQFKSGIFWFLACLFIPIVSLIWLVLHWEVGARPFLVYLLGVGLCFVGLFLGGNL